MLTCRFGGQLGNIMLEMFGVFWYAKKHNLPFSNVVFNENYTVATQEDVPIVHDDYITNNMPILQNIAQHFIPCNDIKNIQFFECQEKHILHGDDIDPAKFKNISFRQFDFRFPHTDDERHMFNELFYVPSLVDSLKKRFSNKFNFENSAVVHVRRTDFKNFHNGKFIQSPEQIARKIANHSIQMPTKTYVVFSDDIEWCKQNLSKLNANVVFNDLGLHIYEDMALMSMMKCGIIGNNSSFSYCAQLLNNSMSLSKCIPPRY